MTDCHYYEGCSANLCPQDPIAADRTWFPDEDICRLQAVPAWVRRQKVIARKTAKDPTRGCFTVAMLSRRCTIGSAFRGLDSEDGPADGPADGNRVDVWLKKHPAVTQKGAKVPHGFAKKDQSVAVKT